MRVVIQRVKSCQIEINSKIHSKIENGLLVLLGIIDGDDASDISWLARKITQLRIFDDDNGVMNLSVEDKDYSIMVVSQFTLYGSTKKGNRPSYIKAAKPEKAIPIYRAFVKELKQMGNTIETGLFGAHMNITLNNDGPVTLIIDTKQKE